MGNRTRTAAERPRSGRIWRRPGWLTRAAGTGHHIVIESQKSAGLKSLLDEVTEAHGGLSRAWPSRTRGLISAQFESMVKRMQHGFASRHGLTAAALAVT